MFVDGFGEILTDILTVNPALSSVDTHFLDASNYTFQAVTFGKDAAGFNFHAHDPSTIDYADFDIHGSTSSASSFNVIDGVKSVVAINYKNSGNYVSSYVPSSTQARFINTYNSLAGYPSPYHTRLEQSSTRSTVASSFSSTLPDLGHYPNPYLDITVSSAWNVLGGFAPPSGEAQNYILCRPDGTHITSGILSGVFNEYKLADKEGHVRISPVSGLARSDINKILFKDGPVIFSSTADHILPISSTAIAVVPQMGDAVTLSMFGGVSHLGVYCFDMKAMLAAGVQPPYSWNAINNVRVGNELNNNRKYKLVSKVTFWDNLMILSDKGFTSDPKHMGGLEEGYNMGSLSNGGPTFILKFNFL